MPEPNFQDRVKHKTSATNTTGIVIAKYPVENVMRQAIALGLMLRKDCRVHPSGKQFLDVRSDDGDRIYWATPAENWETISTEEERFE